MEKGHVADGWCNIVHKGLGKVVWQPLEEKTLE
jgi:hypothetical protein